MDYFYKDISNIIGEYVNGDKKYWKEQYDKVVYGELDYCIQSYNSLITHQTVSMSPFVIIGDIQNYNFMKFLKTTSRNPLFL
jgi:hypothetical protein